MKSLRHIFKRLRFMKSNCCKKLHGDWQNSTHAAKEISPYTISNLFQGMVLSGGREIAGTRVCRSLVIDLNSVH